MQVLGGAKLAGEPRHRRRGEARSGLHGAFARAGGAPHQTGVEPSLLQLTGEEERLAGRSPHVQPGHDPQHARPLEGRMTRALGCGDHVGDGCGRSHGRCGRSTRGRDADRLHGSGIDTLDPDADARNRVSQAVGSGSAATSPAISAGRHPWTPPPADEQRRGSHPVARPQQVVVMDVGKVVAADPDQMGRLPRRNQRATGVAVGSESRRPRWPPASIGRRRSCRR